jgi:hypothetical protein
VAKAGLTLNEADFAKLLAYVWPSLQKMKVRDGKYAAARAKLFTTDAGRAYLRELSIDELPGLTTPETTAIMLALCEALGMKIHFVAPAFGFQKNMPYPDNVALRGLIEKQWAVCKDFGASIGFHSGSGKSAENYQVMGAVTGGRLEIKTSGRYTYEMGRALFASANAADQALWRDWYRFTLELAILGAFSADATEQKMARVFIADALTKCGRGTEVFANPTVTRSALESLPPSPEHMFWFEYNFLHVLAAGGRADAARARADHHDRRGIDEERAARMRQPGREALGRAVLEDQLDARGILAHRLQPASQLQRRRLRERIDKHALKRVSHDGEGLRRAVGCDEGGLGTHQRCDVNVQQLEAAALSAQDPAHRQRCALHLLAKPQPRQHGGTAVDLDAAASPGLELGTAVEDHNLLHARIELAQSPRERQPADAGAHDGDATRRRHSHARRRRPSCIGEDARRDQRWTKRRATRIGRQKKEDGRHFMHCLRPRFHTKPRSQSLDRVLPGEIVSVM